MYLFRCATNFFEEIVEGNTGCVKAKNSVLSAASTLFEDDQGTVTLANVPKMIP